MRAGGASRARVGFPRAAAPASASDAIGRPWRMLSNCQIVDRPRPRLMASHEGIRDCAAMSKSGSRSDARTTVPACGATGRRSASRVTDSSAVARCLGASGRAARPDVVRGGWRPHVAGETRQSRVKVLWITRDRPNRAPCRSCRRREQGSGALERFPDVRIMAEQRSDGLFRISPTAISGPWARKKCGRPPVEPTRRTPPQVGRSAPRRASDTQPGPDHSPRT